MKFKVEFIIIFIGIIVFQKNYAQDILWEKSYGGKHAEYLYDIIPTPDYGFIMGGSSISKKTGNKTEDNKGDLDYWIWKMDEKGDLDWQKNFGGVGQDLLKVVLLTNEGGFLLAGQSNSNEGQDKKENSRGQSDFWIIKLNAKGGEEWQRTIGGIGQDNLSSIVRTRDGGYVVGGSSASGISGDKKTEHYGGLDYWVMKLDADGTIVWQQSFGGIYNDELSSIVLTQDGGYLLGGSSNSSESGNKTEKHLGAYDYWIVKLDKEGNEQWQKSIGSKGNDQLSNLLVAKDGNYIIGGNSNSESGDDKRTNNENGSDFWILKLDKDTREILWQATYDIGKDDMLMSLIENDDQSLLLGGYTHGERVKSKSKALKPRISKVKEEIEPLKKGTADYVVLKLDSTGEEKWRNSVGSDGEDLLKKVIETRDGAYLLGGTSNGSISRDKNSTKGGRDFWIVKLKDKQKPPKDRVTIESIPNPAIDYTNIIIGYEFKKGTATLVDLGGRVLQQFEIQDRTVPINLQGLPDGIYIVNIKTDISNDGVKIIKKNKK
jgi:hypothetical protein